MAAGDNRRGPERQDGGNTARISGLWLILGEGALAVLFIEVLLKVAQLVRDEAEGVVDRESDKNMAGIRANGVPGVFSVRNNLVVPGKGK